MRVVTLTVVAILSLAGCGKSEPSEGDKIMADVRRSIKNDKEWETEYKNYKFPTAKVKPKTISHEYSEFDKQSSFSTEFFPFGTGELFMTFSSDSKESVNVKPPAEIALSFYKDTPFDFRFMADGVQITPRREYLGMFKLHTRDLLKIVAADKVLVRVNSDEFAMSESEKRMFYHVLSVMGN